MRFDLHVHTVISPCSRLKFSEILGHARSMGLEGVCITDHGTMEVCRHLKEGVQEDGLCVIFGMEYETPEGHFLLFGPFEGLPAGLSAPALLRLVGDCGGAAVAAHPCRQVAPTREYLVRKGLCRAIEVFNGRNLDAENRQTSRWCESYSLHECAGSDAHSLDELGRMVTHFSEPVRCREDLIFALNHGLCAPECRTQAGSVFGTGNAERIPQAIADFG
ncbi:MAG: PHP domain-containing protein [Deltaproteobacteria bacterium]|nr:PHP domain-containing protein [Deltaproteobacteria bacterium]